MCVPTTVKLVDVARQVVPVVVSVAHAHSVPIANVVLRVPVLPLACHVRVVVRTAATDQDVLVLPGPDVVTVTLWHTTATVVTVPDAFFILCAALQLPIGDVALIAAVLVDQQVLGTVLHGLRTPIQIWPHPPTTRVIEDGQLVPVPTTFLMEALVFQPVLQLLIGMTVVRLGIAALVRANKHLVLQLHQAAPHHDVGLALVQAHSHCPPEAWLVHDVGMRLPVHILFRQPACPVFEERRVVFIRVERDGAIR